MYNPGGNMQPNQGQQMSMPNQVPPMQMHSQGQMITMQGQSMPMQGQGQPMPMQGQGQPMPMQSQGQPMPIQSQGLPMQSQGQPMLMQSQGQPMPMPMQSQSQPMPMQGQNQPMQMQGQGQPVQLPQQQQNPSPMMVSMSTHQQQTHRQSPAMVIAQQSISSNNAPMMAPNTPQQLHQQNIQAVLLQMDTEENQEHEWQTKFIDACEEIASFRIASGSQYSPYAASVLSQGSNAPASHDYPSVPSNIPSVQSQQPQQPPVGQPASVSSQPQSSRSDAPSGTAPTPFITPETDPIAIIKRMILVDLRHDLQNWSSASNTLAQKRLVVAADEAGGASADAVLKSVPPPPSNINNPLSVNPQSVAPPPSMNPMSVNPPSSATDGETVAAGGVDASVESAIPAALLTAEEQYVNCRNKLFNTIDTIERAGMTITEGINHVLRLQSTCLVSVPMDYSTVEVSQMQQKFVDEKRQQIAAVMAVVNSLQDLRLEINPSLNKKSSAAKVDAPPEEESMS